MVYKIAEWDNVAGAMVERDASDEEMAEIEARAADSLAAAINAADRKTYTDVDTVTADAVGNRTEEYRDAEEAARAFAAAGYEGDVDLSVSSYAQFNPTGEAQTNQWAADQIITRADAFRAAQKEMRAKRFESQAAIRAATNLDELNAAVAAWDQFIAETRSALGL